MCRERSPTLRRAWLAVALAASLSACDDDAAGPPAGVRDDIVGLRLVLVQDPARQPLEEVERVVEGRPVEAARRLRTAGIPAARQQLSYAEDLTVGTPTGRGFRRRLISAYRDRIAALEQYADVLEGAASDQDALLDALSAQSAVELEVMAIDADMEDLVPTALPAPPAGGEPAGEESEPEAPGGRPRAR